MPHYAIEYGRRAVRGKVEAASVIVYVDGTVAWSGDLPLEKAPYQTNNMDEWLVVIIREVNPKQLDEIRRKGFWDELTYVFNDGRGILKGRDARRNKFTYGFELDERHVGTLKTFHQDFRIELLISTVGYSNLYHQKLKAEGKVAPYVERRRAEADTAEGFFVDENEAEDELGEDF